MYNLSVVVSKDNHTNIGLYKTNLINHNFISARFIEGKDIVGLYISHQLGNPDIDNLIREIGYSVLDVTHIPNIQEYNIKSIETTHIFFWDINGYLKRVSIENGIIHHHKDNVIISEYPITTGAKVECLQTLRGLTRHDIDGQISVKVVEEDGHNAPYSSN